jgi:hypothetical protein
MRKRVFISYDSADRRKMDALSRALEDDLDLQPIVVPKRQRSGVALPIKVAEAIEEADVLVPILTRGALSSQWVNQEIGYAFGHGTPVHPVVERSLVVNNTLKGFIHCQLDLPYQYSSSISPHKEAASFRKAYLALIEFLPNVNEEFEFRASVAPRKITLGTTELGRTEAYFRGAITHGFVTTRLRHLATGEKFWKPDYDSSPRSGTRPGTINGTNVEVVSSYPWPVAGLPTGDYEATVAIYSHRVPGERGRDQIRYRRHRLAVV